MNEPLLRVQTFGAPPAKRRSTKHATSCLKCWEPIVPLAGHDDLVGGFGHRRECPDRGIEPNAGDVAGRWLYAEPGWDIPVVLCETCGEAAYEEVGDDENFVILRASEVEDWETIQFLYEDPSTTCWDCGRALPEIVDPAAPDGGDGR